MTSTVLIAGAVVALLVLLFYPLAALLRLKNPTVHRPPLKAPEMYSPVYPPDRNSEPSLDLYGALIAQGVVTREEARTEFEMIVDREAVAAARAREAVENMRRLLDIPPAPPPAPEARTEFELITSGAAADVALPGRRPLLIPQEPPPTPPVPTPPPDDRPRAARIVIE